MINLHYQRISSQKLLQPTQPPMVWTNQSLQDGLLDELRATNFSLNINEAINDAWDNIMNIMVSICIL